MDIPTLRVFHTAGPPDLNLSCSSAHDADCCAFVSCGRSPGVYLSAMAQVRVAASGEIFCCTLTLVSITRETRECSFAYPRRFG